MVCSEARTEGDFGGLSKVWGHIVLHGRLKEFSVARVTMQAYVLVFEM